MWCLKYHAVALQNLHYNEWSVSCNLFTKVAIYLQKLQCSNLLNFHFQYPIHQLGVHTYFFLANFFVPNFAMLPCGLVMDYRSLPPGLIRVNRHLKCGLFLSPKINPGNFLDCVQTWILRCIYILILVKQCSFKDRSWQKKVLYNTKKCIEQYWLI